MACTTLNHAHSLHSTHTTLDHPQQHSFLPRPQARSTKTGQTRAPLSLSQRMQAMSQGHQHPRCQTYTAHQANVLPSSTVVKCLTASTSYYSILLDRHSSIHRLAPYTPASIPPYLPTHPSSTYARMCATLYFSHASACVPRSFFPFPPRTCTHTTLFFQPRTFFFLFPPHTCMRATLC